MGGHNFELSVTSGFTEDGEWLIDIRADQQIPPDVDLGAFRLAVLEVIAREGQRGRSLNAERVRVHLDRSILELDAALASISDMVH